MSPDPVRLIAEISKIIRTISDNVGPGAETSGDTRLVDDLELDSGSLGELTDQILSRYGPDADSVLPFLAKRGAELRIADLAEYLASVLQDGKPAGTQAPRSAAEPSRAVLIGDEGPATQPGPRASDQRGGRDPWVAPNHHQPLNDNVAVLSERAADTRRDLLRLPSGDVEIFSAGDGPPLILMHPLNVGAGVFAWQFADLADHYRVICVHNPGVGATTWNDDLSLSGLAQFHRTVLMELSVAPPFHVLGACFGGNVAQEFALLHPAECTSLVLVGSFPPGDRDGGPRSLLAAAREEFDLMCAAGGQGLEGERVVLEDLLLRSESMNTWFGLAYLQVLAAKPSLRTQLSEIAAPTLILRGQLDTMMGVRHAELLHETIPSAKFAELADTGHFPYLTHRAKFGSVLTPFLTRAGKRSPVSGDA
jgi:pimeloyl-ACP methyl ester carboxylesterase